MLLLRYKECLLVFLLNYDVSVVCFQDLPVVAILHHQRPSLSHAVKHDSLDMCNTCRAVLLSVGGGVLPLPVLNAEEAQVAVR
jgi:hypothetical protein